MQYIEGGGPLTFRQKITPIVCLLFIVGIIVWISLDTRFHQVESKETSNVQVTEPLIGVGAIHTIYDKKGNQISRDTVLPDVYYGDYDTIIWVRMNYIKRH